MKYSILFFIFLAFSGAAMAQKTLVEGYTYEGGNRGYLNQVKVTVYSLPENGVKAEIFTDMEGKFACELPSGQSYRLYFKKDIFHELNDTIEVGTEKIFRKISMKRKPGYVFEVTLAESRSNENQIVDAIAGTRIDVYNNTTKKVEWTEEYHPTPYFKHNLEQGNHYTLLFRKQGYEDKQIDAHVNIDGCIICIEGVSLLRPGVIDNLTANNTMGTLLANIDMKKLRNYKPSNMHDTVWVKTLPSLEEIVREKEMDKAINQLGDQKEVKIAQNVQVKTTNTAISTTSTPQKVEPNTRAPAASPVEEPNAIPAPRREQVQLPEANNKVKLPEKEQAIEVVEEKMIPIAMEKEIPAPEDTPIVELKEEVTTTVTAEGSNKKESNIGTGGTSTSPNSKFLTPLPDNFTGYTIEIGAFETPIDGNDQHFKKSGQLYYKQEADGKYYYYSGNAASPQRIISYFDAVVKPRFESARICLFKDGVKEYVK